MHEADQAATRQQREVRVRDRDHLLAGSGAIIIRSAALRGPVHYGTTLAMRPRSSSALTCSAAFMASAGAASARSGLMSRYSRGPQRRIWDSSSSASLSHSAFSARSVSSVVQWPGHVGLQRAERQAQVHVVAESVPHVIKRRLRQLRACSFGGSAGLARFRHRSQLRFAALGNNGVAGLNRPQRGFGARSFA
jgi:hypothetical protein